jgi:D-glycero-D-manno-heptose 1,7-bisphosphate phosphatase
VKTVIMAGGRGTRLAPVTGDELPKAMVPLLGKPLLEYQSAALVRNGLGDIIIALGHLGGVIKKHFGNGRAFGCTISYYEETEPLGTAGALYQIADRLGDEFLLINGDILFDVDFSRMIAFHRSRAAFSGGTVTLAVHPNNHPFDSALIESGAGGRVTAWHNKEDRAPEKQNAAKNHYYRNSVNAGLHLISKKALLSIKPQGGRVDLDREVLQPLAAAGRLYAYHTPEYIKDLGTPERYEQVRADAQSGLPASRNLGKKQRAVFLDRDGTINAFNGFITRARDLALLDGAAEGIALLNRAGWMVIVITNQPVIARGEASLEELEQIHNKMEEDLGRGGAYVDDIFFCPHHPDGGFAGERAEYKVDCPCRKPKPGLILKAAEQYNIDTAASWMAGDGERDMLAGRAARCRTALIAKERPAKNDFGADIVVPDLISLAARLTNDAITLH